MLTKVVWFWSRIVFERQFKVDLRVVRNLECWKVKVVTPGLAEIFLAVKDIRQGNATLSQKCRNEINNLILLY